MSQRLDAVKAAPDALAPMLALEKYLAGCGLEKPLIELVKMRVSQLNGCAFCLDMHSKDARAAGESEQRLYLLPAWRECSFYNARERAALAWAESLTLISQTGAPDADYAQVRKVFSDKEIVDLTMAVVAINGWNRLAIGLRREPGTYQPPKKAAAR